MQWIAEGRLAVLAYLYFFYALIVLLLPAPIYSEMRRPILQQVRCQDRVAVKMDPLANRPHNHTVAFGSAFLRGEVHLSLEELQLQIVQCRAGHGKVRKHTIQQPHDRQPEDCRDLQSAELVQGWCLD